MAIKNAVGEWVCSYCGSVAPSAREADECRDSHNLLYIPMSKEELNRLITFIFTKDESLLSRDFIYRLRKYMRLQ